MAEWYEQLSIRLGICRLGFNSKSGQTSDFKIGIHTFLAWRSALKESSVKKKPQFSCCVVVKGT